MNFEQKTTAALEMVMVTLGKHGEILEKLVTKVDNLEQGQKSLEQNLKAVEQRLGNVEQRLGNVEQRLGKVEFYVQSVHQLVNEDYNAIQSISEKADRLEIITEDHEEKFRKIKAL